MNMMSEELNEQQSEMLKITACKLNKAFQPMDDMDEDNLLRLFACFNHDNLCKFSCRYAMEHRKEFSMKAYYKSFSEYCDGLIREDLCKAGPTLACEYTMDWMEKEETEENFNLLGEVILKRMIGVDIVPLGSLRA